jgi:DNA anti-recombination protein RmuC
MLPMAKEPTNQDILNKLSSIEERMATKTEIAEVTEVVSFIKNRVVTIEDKVEKLEIKMDTVSEKLTAVERSLTNRLDNEVDKRGRLEARVTKLEVARK